MKDMRNQLLFHRYRSVILGWNLSERNSVEIAFNATSIRIISILARSLIRKNARDNTYYFYSTTRAAQTGRILFQRGLQSLQYRFDVTGLQRYKGSDTASDIANPVRSSIRIAITGKSVSPAISSLNHRYWFQSII